MSLLSNEVKHLLLKEIREDFRQKYALAGMLLYIFSTVFISYLSFRNLIHPATWNALFWIITLFAAINAVAKSFMQESRGKLLYYYTLVSPQGIIAAKLIYNSLLLLGLTLVCFLLYSVFIKNIVQDTAFFLLSILLGSIGFASVLTMISAIAAKTNNNIGLVAILSFPMLIPILITLLKVSKNAIDGLDPSLSYPYFWVLVLINLIVIILSYILFPYLWRE